MAISPARSNTSSFFVITKYSEQLSLCVEAKSQAFMTEANSQVTVLSSNGFLDHALVLFYT